MLEQVSLKLAYNTKQGRISLGNQAQICPCFEGRVSLRFALNHEPTSCGLFGREGGSS